MLNVDNLKLEHNIDVFNHNTMPYRSVIKNINVLKVDM